MDARDQLNHVLRARTKKRRRSAFSLVELSIVLVILGLLTGGILAGQSLIRASALKNVIHEYAQYITAVQAFRGKYTALPGDFAMATSFWGAVNADPDLCRTTASNGTLTCNGNGNGNIGHMGGEGSDAINYERFHFWIQLSNAGLIGGSYNGVGGAGGESQSVIGVNVPASRFPNAGWTPMNRTLVTDEANPNMFVRNGDGNDLQIGANPSPTSNRGTQNPIFTPEEAWGIDMKTDDGKPGTGRAMTRKGLTNCHVWSGSAATATYNLGNTATVCMLNFQF